MKASDAAPHVLEALAGGEPVAEVVRVAGPSAGERVLVWAGRRLGSFGAPELDARAEELGREAIETGRGGTTDVELAGAVHSLYVEPHAAPGELVIVGAGHIARPLARLGAMLGFRVVVLDDRPEFATRERFPEAQRLVRADFTDPFRDVPITRTSHIVLVTRGHRYDYDALRQVLAGEVQPAYIGMVGSKRRVRAAFEQLAREGVPPDRLRSIHAPIGLDIAAETPEEIAVAIAAELILVRRGGSGVPMRDRARVVERWIARVD